MRLLDGCRGLAAGAFALVVLAGSSADAATVTYSESFISGMGYNAGSPQFDNWGTFASGAPASGIQSVTISGSRDATGRTCSVTASAQSIMDNLRTGASATVSCGGHNWTTGTCGSGTELTVGAATNVCVCNDGNYVLRPQIGSGSAHWGGINGNTCTAPSQTMTASYTSTSPLEVTNTNDSGAGSLRAAITHANANASDDAITFNIPGAGPHTITLTSNLPNIVDTGISIDGTTQSGASCGTLVTGTQHDLRIVIDGNAGTAGRLLRISAANVTIRGLSLVGGADSGIFSFSTADDLQIDCNYVGVEPDGVTKNPNARSANDWNIQLYQSDNAVVSNNLLSGTDFTADDGGLLLNANDNAEVTGNIIGLDAAGTGALGNSLYGIYLFNATDTQIGGDSATERNVISGNTGLGIYIVGASTDETVIEGNYIGVGRDGSSAFGNSQGGIRAIAGAGTIIGGTDSDDGNIIANNGDDGVEFTSTASGAVLGGNSIHSNTGLGINLSGGSEDGSGVTANDSGDGDSGVNDLLNYPVINSFAADGTTAVGYDINLDVPANGNGYRIDFLRNTAADASGHGEGGIHLGSVDVAHGGGDLNFTGSFTANTAVSSGNIITATTTRKTGGASYDITSEFSATRAAFTANPAQLAATKTITVIDDGLVGGDDTVAIPGATLRYTITVRNDGSGPADTDATVVIDEIPSNGAFKVTDYNASPGAGPVGVSQGSPSSGLSYNFVSLGSGADDIAFSDDNGASWTYTPSDSGGGTDLSVTHIRVSPTGAFNANSGVPPSISLRYDVVLF